MTWLLLSNRLASCHLLDNKTAVFDQTLTHIRRTYFVSARNQAELEQKVRNRWRQELHKTRLTFPVAVGIVDIVISGCFKQEVGQINSFLRVILYPERTSFTMKTWKRMTKSARKTSGLVSTGGRLFPANPGSKIETMHSFYTNVTSGWNPVRELNLIKSMKSYGSQFSFNLNILFERAWMITAVRRLACYSSEWNLTSFMKYHVLHLNGESCMQ